MGYKLALLGTVAVLVQSISGQCIGNLNAGPVRGFGNSMPYGSNMAGAAGSFGPNLAGAAGSFGPNLAGAAGPFGPNLAGKSGQGYSASTGGGFAITSTSPVSPVGLSVLAENLAIEGPLNVGGSLPFLGSVAIEGAMPGAGSGLVSYGCGSGNVGIVSENAVGIAGPYGLAGSPIAGSPGTYGSPIGPSSVGSYGQAVAGPYGLAGSPLSSSGGNFGLVGSPIGSAGLGSGLGFNGFNGLRQ